MYHIFPSYHYYEHPTDPNYLIFTFRKKEMAEHFASELDMLSIHCQTDTDVTPRDITLHHFAVLQSDRKVTIDVFYKTWGKFRKPFINGTLVKILMLIFSVSLITLAIIGYLKN
ncbi:MAG: hypothetical protein ACPGVD_03060 [Flavobacteriales bacterium]